MVSSFYRERRSLLSAQMQNASEIKGAVELARQTKIMTNALFPQRFLLPSALFIISYTLFSCPPLLVPVHSTPSIQHKFQVSEANPLIPETLHKL